jgi:hypothetical protein
MAGQPAPQLTDRQNRSYTAKLRISKAGKGRI